MDIENHLDNESLILRLKRIEGQVRGVQGMITTGRECREVIQQLNSVRAAVQSVAQAYLRKYAIECLLTIDDKDERQREEIALELVNYMGKIST